MANNPFFQFSALLVVGAASAATLQVGPGKQFAAPCAALAVAANGDTIQIDPVLYSGDVCAFSQSNLTIRGVNGRAHIVGLHRCVLWKSLSRCGKHGVLF